MSKTLFLWWESTFAKVADPMIHEQREDLKRSEREEIADMENQLSLMELTRPSNVSKAKYNHWLVADHKRLRGEEKRAEAEAVRTRNKTSAISFLNAVHDRTLQHHTEREAAAEAVRGQQAALMLKTADARRQGADIREKRKQQAGSWQTSTHRACCRSCAMFYAHPASLVWHSGPG